MGKPRYAHRRALREMTDHVNTKTWQPAEDPWADAAEIFSAEFFGGNHGDTYRVAELIGRRLRIASHKERSVNRQTGQPLSKPTLDVFFWFADEDWEMAPQHVVSLSSPAVRLQLDTWQRKSRGRHIWASLEYLPGTENMRRRTVYLAYRPE